jgi:CHAT domain-containing protein
MAQSLFLRSVQSKFLSSVVCCGLILSIDLPLVQIQASSSSLYAGREAEPCAGLVRPAQEDPQARQLEPGKPIERELAGGQSHSYQIALDAGQYIKLAIGQRGIDVAVQLLGPDGKQIARVDSDSSGQGKETVEHVAEGPGNHRLNVLPKQKNATAGRYEIQVLELRVATENDRLLQEARKLNMEFRNLYFAGKYDVAIPLAERVLELRKRALGPEHLDVSFTLSNLAILYYYRSNYAKAELLFQQGLAICEKAGGPENRDIAGLTSMILNNLANVYTTRGDYTKAEPLHQRALEIREKWFGPMHPDTANSLNNLANLYRNRGEYTKAEPLYQRSLIIREKSLGPEHTYFAIVLYFLASLYNDRGDYAKAESFYGRALGIWEKSLGPEHSFVADALHGLAGIYSDRGDYAKAESFYGRALAIREKALGPVHRDVAATLNGLAVLCAAKGDNAQAITYQSRAHAVIERNFELNLAAGSERQKLAYLALFSQDTDLTLSLHSQHAPNDPLALNLAFTTVLRRKGRGLDAMSDTIATLRRRATPQDQALFDQLADVRAQLAALTLKDPGATPDAYRAQFKPLEEKVEALEAELGARSAEFRAQSQPVTLAAIQAALPAGGALIEFAVYTPQEPRTRKNQAPRYLAYLLAAQGQPKWVDLGDAATIDRAVDAWRESLRNRNRPDVNRLARALDDKVMRPVRSLMADMPIDTSHLLIAPDGSLNLIPFAALVDEQNRYLIERYSISYLTSGRDLLRLQTTQPSKSAPLIVANPDFEKGVAVAMRGGKSSRRSRGADQGRAQSDLTDVSFPPLPGTRAEALAVKAALPDASLLLQERATETALKQAKAPRFLHIATHGFFLGDQETPPAETLGVLDDDPLRISDMRLSKWTAYIKDPLLRSGLALAGANRSRSGDDDGLLTALEMAGLDLLGTKLVVLSACDTGLGEVRNGEGVQGLRRALVLAGAESQMMSLWPVLDIRTKDLMIPYYQALSRGEGRGEALKQVQLKMLQSKYQSHPFYWAAFILSGEWRALDGQQRDQKAKSKR